METKTTTSGGSPLKEWVKKHSPLKTRSNKPLPPTPGTEEASPTRKPGTAISGNANANASSLTLNNDINKRPKKRISSLLGHRKTSEQVSKIQDLTNDEPKSKQTRNKTKQTQSNAVDASSTLRPLAQSPGSFNRLSDRVSSLEAQLYAARRELDSFRDKSNNGAGARPSPRRARSFDIDSDHEVALRQASLSGRGRFDGLVENLLDAQRSASPIPTLSPYTNHSRRGFSVDVSRMPSEQERPRSRNPKAEDVLGPSDQDETERRRLLRSQLRQASWHQMQENLAAQGHARSFSAGSKRSYSENLDADRPARRQKQSHDKDLPVPPIPSKYLPSTDSKQNPLKSNPTTGNTKARKSAAISKSNDVNAHPSATDIEKAEIRSPVAVDADTRSHSPYRNRIPSPPRLPAVSEEFEWNDEEIF